MSNADPRYTIHLGDVRAVLKSLPAESVHCCVTSPPYWSLRDYGTAQWAGGSADCDHQQHPGAATGNKGAVTTVPYKHTCGKCGADRQDHQLGLEATVGEYISNMVAVFEDVRRVLRRDGLCFVNLGDSYAGGPGGSQGGTGQRANRTITTPPIRKDNRGLKPKDLALVPQRLAISLQDAGWWVRSVIIWDKSNPMPESVTDRPTTSHEYVLMLAKNSSYYYDAEAIAERSIKPDGITWDERKALGEGMRRGFSQNAPGAALAHMQSGAAGRNKRTVWRIPSHSFEGAHFATFPPALVEPMIKAATSQRGCCPSCMAPYRRVVNVRYENIIQGNGNGARKGVMPDERKTFAERADKVVETTGWTPTCKCSTDAPLVPAVVLDCFSGASTTGLVALRLGRHYVGIELNQEYIEMSHRRIEADAGANQMHMSLEER